MASCVNGNTHNDIMQSLLNDFMQVNVLARTGICMEQVALRSVPLLSYKLVERNLFACQLEGGCFVVVRDKKHELFL